MVHYTVVSISSHHVIKPWALRSLPLLDFPAGVSSHDLVWLPSHAILLVHQQCYEQGDIHQFFVPSYRARSSRETHWVGVSGLGSSLVKYEVARASSAVNRFSGS